MKHFLCNTLLPRTILDGYQDFNRAYDSLKSGHFKIALYRTLTRLLYEAMVHDVLQIAVRNKDTSLTSKFGLLSAEARHSDHYHLHIIRVEAQHFVHTLRPGHNTSSDAVLLNDERDELVQEILING